MSVGLYNIESLRFWNDEEIFLRYQFVDKIVYRFKSEMSKINKAWTFKQVDGPLLTPRSRISQSYDENDIFITQVEKANQKLVLRPETTPSSYQYAKYLLNNHSKTKLPLCVYQLGKSFRVEASDGATASKLRYNEFYQLEFQFIYTDTTQMDYRSVLIEKLELEVGRFIGLPTRTIDSDRLPEYSESTKDVEVLWNGEYKEVASCSVRKDFEPNIKVCEIAIGIDRITEMLGVES